MSLLTLLIGSARRGRCHYCRGMFTRGELSADHKIPVARGGTDAIENLVVACRRCNGRKGQATEAEFLGLRARGLA